MSHTDYYLEGLGTQSGFLCALFGNPTLKTSPQLLVAVVIPVSMPGLSAIQHHTGKPGATSCDLQSTRSHPVAPGRTRHRPPQDKFSLRIRNPCRMHRGWVPRQHKTACPGHAVARIGGRYPLSTRHGFRSVPFLSFRHAC